MRRAFAALVLCSAFVGSGCGVVGTSQAVLPAPQHGGNILALPGGKGFAELLVERGSPPKGKAAASTTRLLAYFYQPDGTSTLAPPPTDVKLRLGEADKGTDVKLTSQTSPAGQLASEPGQYPSELRGELACTLGAEPVQAPFMFR
jgi:hypothetical protein